MPGGQRGGAGKAWVCSPEGQCPRTTIKQTLLSVLNGTGSGLGKVAEVGKVETTGELDLVLVKREIPREPQRQRQTAVILVP